MSTYESKVPNQDYYLHLGSRFVVLQAASYQHQGHPTAPLPCEKVTLSAVRVFLLLISKPQECEHDR